jgi:hypothetical protein
MAVLLMAQTPHFGRFVSAIQQHNRGLGAWDRVV